MFIATMEFLVVVRVKEADGSEVVLWTGWIHFRSLILNSCEFRCLRTTPSINLKTQILQTGSSKKNRTLIFAISAGSLIFCFLLTEDTSSEGRLTLQCCASGLESAFVGDLIWFCRFLHSRILSLNCFLSSSFFSCFFFW